MAKFINNYKYIIIGLFASIMGYVVFHALGIDIKEKIHIYVNHLERLEIDEILAVWVKFFLVFVLINYIVNIEKRKHKAKKKIYISMLYATNHILKNFLFQTQILQLELESHQDFDEDVIKMYEESKEEAEILIKKLSEVKNIDDKAIYEAIKAEAKFSASKDVTT
jgi:hypothetical protein